MLRSMIYGLLLLSLSIVLPGTVPGADDKGKVYDDPAHVDDDYAFQGEYTGKLGSENEQWGLQIIALGEGKFQAVAYPGGLPGDGADMTRKIPAEGSLDNGSLKLKSDHGTAVIDGKGEAAIFDREQNSVGQLRRVIRKSPTLGAKPPEGAVVLFDGKSADAFEGGRMTKDGLLMQGITSKQKFGDCVVHLEFRTPYQPTARGQGRGNSGCYLQGRYEVQILDSFGLEGKDNEAGGIYTIKSPSVNMCYPPLTWQTYDIEYTAAKFDADGKKTQHARMTVKHNGVLVQDKTELDHSTTASPLKEGPEPGPLYIQDHGNPVRFQNIWVVPK